MAILFLITFIDILAFGVLMPLLPYLKIIYNVSTTEVSLLITAFAASSLIGSIFWGMLSDKYGRKPFLVIPLILAGIMAVFSSFTIIFWQVLLLRILFGFFTSHFPVAFAAVADMTSGENIKKRFPALATLGLAFSSGLVLAPFVGGFLSKPDGLFSSFAFINQFVYYADYDQGVNLAVPFLLSAFFSFLSAILAILFFKETLAKKDREEKSDSVFKQLSGIYHNKTILLFTYLTIIFNFIIAGLEVTINLFLYDAFRFPVHYIGYYWAFFGFILAINRFVFIPLYSKPKLSMVLAFSLIGLGLLMFILAYNIAVVIIATIIIALFAGLGFAVINAGISFEGRMNQQGTIFGVNQLFGNVGRSIAPVLVASIYAFSINLSWVFMGALALSCLPLIIKIVKSDKDRAA